MKPLAAVLILSAVALAGCTDDPEPTDFSKQSLTITFLHLEQGFTVILPLWISDGAEPEVWLNAFRVTGNATLSIVETERGEGLRIDGQDNIRLDAQDVIVVEHPEAFTRGSFSLGSGNGRAWMQVVAGDVDVTQYHYEAISADCDATITQYWTDVQSGWHVADANSRITMRCS